MCKSAYHLRVLVALAVAAGCHPESSEAGPAYPVQMNDDDDGDDDQDDDGDSGDGNGDGSDDDQSEPVDPGDTCYELVEAPFMFPDDGVPPGDPVTSSSSSYEEDGLEFECHSEIVDATKDHSEIVAVVNNYNLQPGLVVDGESVHTGFVRSLSLPRNPARLFIDLPVENPEAYVEVPTSGSLANAVADLQREADHVLGTLPEIPATLTLDIFEAHSFKQMMQELGVSAEFSAPFASAGLDVDLSEQQSTRKKTVVVRLFQPMYNIAFEDDALERNRDFFSDDVGWTDDATCEQLGGPFPAAYVKSVTYGRMVLYTVSSEEFHSANELAVALRASYEGVTFGGSVEAERRERYEEMMASSNVRVMVMGGSQTDAFEAVSTGDFRPFFRASRSINAVPLAVRLSYLSEGRPTLALKSTTQFTRECCTPTNCSVPPVHTVQIAADQYDTGWHLGGEAGRAYGDIWGGACGEGRSRQQIRGTRINGDGQCYGQWVSDEAGDCRARFLYDRPGGAFLVCHWEILADEELPHPEPLCRAPGC